MEIKGYYVGCGRSFEETFSYRFIRLQEKSARDYIMCCTVVVILSVPPEEYNVPLGVHVPQTGYPGLNTSMYCSIHSIYPLLRLFLIVIISNYYY